MQEKLSEQPRTVNWCGHLELTGSMLDQLLIAVQAQARYCDIQLEYCALHLEVELPFSDLILGSTPQ